jgi:hypothetical protein
MGVEDQNTVSVSHEQALMDIIESQPCFGAPGPICSIDLRLPPPTQQTTMPHHMIRSMANMVTFLIQLVHQHTNITRFRYKHPVMDAVQRHRTGSPYAV